MTPVLFRVENNGGEVIAVFPTHPGTYNSETCSMYAHLGQHSSCSLAYLPYYTRPATEAEYASLLRELKAIGYDDLKIVKRIHPSYHRTRRENLYV